MIAIVVACIVYGGHVNTSSINNCLVVTEVVLIIDSDSDSDSDCGSINNDMR